MMTREEKKAAKKAAWLATPPALIERPLKYIASNVNYYDKEKQATVISPVYTVAKRHAARGRGDTVQMIARGLSSNKQLSA